MRDPMLCFVEDNQIAKVIRGDDAKGAGLPVAVIRSLRAKLRLVLAAPDIKTLKNWRSLDFHEVGNQWVIQISEEWAMRVEIVSVEGDHEMKIKALEANAGAAA